MPDAPHPLEESTGGVRPASMRKLARDGKSWTPTEQRTRDRLMKQFCRLEGASGNSPAYQRGWDAAFGTPEQKARALAEIEAEKACGFPAAERVKPGSVFFPNGIPDHIIDPTLPPNTAELRSADGQRVRIIHLGDDE